MPPDLPSPPESVTSLRHGKSGHEEISEVAQDILLPEGNGQAVPPSSVTGGQKYLNFSGVANLSVGFSPNFTKLPDAANHIPRVISALAPSKYRTKADSVLDA